MFQFVGGVTFVLDKYPTKSTGGSRVGGVRKSGDRGPGHGGLALAHVVGCVDVQAPGALGGRFIQSRVDGRYLRWLAPPDHASQIRVAIPSNGFSALRVLHLKV